MFGFAAGTNVAFAAYVEPWDLTGNESFTLRFAGSTAQDPGIVLLMRRLCANGTMTRVQGTRHSVIMCEANGGDTEPIPAGYRLVLYKNSSGSVAGVLPVANQTTVPFLNLYSGVGGFTQAHYQNSTICTVTTYASTANFADYKNYACGSSVPEANSTPDAGISDVEPSLLGWVAGVDNSFGTLSRGPGLLFGVPVSKIFEMLCKQLRPVRLSRVAARSATVLNNACRV